MIKEKALVRIINGAHEGKSGRVASVYPDLGVALVECNESIGMVKVLIDDLLVIPSRENEEIKTEIPEGAKKITRSDFDRAVVRSSLLENKSNDPMQNLVGSMTGVIVGKVAADDIFKGQDAVVMTEDEFIFALWDACNPNHVSEIIDNKMTLYRCIDVSIAGMLNMRNVVRILFGPEND